MLGLMLRSRTMNLGSGRFCIAMFFNNAAADAQDSPQLVIFTGVGVVPSGDPPQHQAQVQMSPNRQDRVVRAMNCVRLPGQWTMTKSMSLCTGFFFSKKKIKTEHQCHKHSSRKKNQWLLLNKHSSAIYEMQHFLRLNIPTHTGIPASAHSPLLFSKYNFIIRNAGTPVKSQSLNSAKKQLCT
jgi:hypothetical protein